MPSGYVVTEAMVGGDPNAMTQDQIENIMCDLALADGD
jgi:hypothetical protein